MRKLLLLAVVLLLAGCAAGPQEKIAEAKPGRCIFSIQTVRYSDHSKEGFFLYVKDSGDVSGEVWRQGKITAAFGGGFEFSRAMHEAFRKAAIPDIDWLAHLEKVRLATAIRDNSNWDKAHGLTQHIQMDFEGSKCDFTLYCAGDYLRYYAKEDEQIKRLDDLVRAIAAEYGLRSMYL